MRKIRTQVQFEPEEHEALRQQARRRGVPLAQVVREAVRALLGLGANDEEMRERFLAAGGIGKEPDAQRDVARRHDDVLHGARR